MTPWLVGLSSVALGVAAAQCSWRSFWALIPVGLGLAWADLSPLWLVPTALAIAGPASWSRARRLARLDDLERDLPGALEATASGLRAGLSLEVAWTTALEGSSGVLADVGHDIRHQLSLGRPLEGAVNDVATREPSSLLEQTARGLQLARETGLDAGRLLDDLARAARDEAEVAARLRSLTAQGRMQAWVLGLMPVALVVLLYAMQPARVEGFFADPRGRVLLAIALGLEALAIVWIRRLVKVG